MKEATRKKTLGALLVIAIIWGTNTLFHPFGNQTVGVEPAPNPTAAPIAAAPVATPLPDLSSRKLQPWGRDPFGKPSRTAPKAESFGPQWLLSGIVYNAAFPVAYINNQMVSPGDRVNDALVVRIDRNKVTLERDGRRFDLYVSQG